MEGSTAGRLLVATPKLTDPNFARTVVYMCMHDENGAFGLVLNRPLHDLPAVEHVPQWARFLVEPACAFAGGPVERTVAVALARRGSSAAVAGLRPLTDDVALVDLAFPAEEFAEEIREMRLFAGYSGWGQQQLDGEIADDAWFVVDAKPGDLFGDDPEALWRRIVLRQPGKVAMFAFSPEDPLVN